MFSCLHCFQKGVLFMPVSVHMWPFPRDRAEGSYTAVLTMFVTGPLNADSRSGPPLSPASPSILSPRPSLLLCESLTNHRKQLSNRVLTAATLDRTQSGQPKNQRTPTQKGKARFLYLETLKMP